MGYMGGEVLIISVGLSLAILGRPTRYMKQSDHSLAPGDMVSGLDAAELIQIRAIRLDAG